MGCVGNPPILEYNLAKKALKEANSHNAKKFAPGLWYKASQAYQKAEGQYSSREYDEASDNFNTALKAAEKAELKARIKKQKRGEVF